MSSPEWLCEISRPETICIEYRNTKGEIKEEIITGMEAKVYQHELDHLNGKRIYHLRKKVM